MKSCKVCGNVLNDSATFCEVCGTPVNENSGAGQSGRTSNGSAQRSYTQYSTNSQQTQSYSPPTGNITPGFSGNSGAAVMLKDGKTKILMAGIILLVILNIALGCVLIFRGGAGTALVNAMDKTAEAPSINCECTISSGAISLNGNLEMYKSDDVNMFAFSAGTGSKGFAVAYDGKAMYTKYGSNTTKSDDKKTTQLCEAISKRDRQALMDYAEKYATSSDSKSDNKNDDELYEQGKEFFKKNLNSPKKCSFIEDYKKDGNKYSMTILGKELIQAMIDDDSLDISDDEKKSMKESLKKIDGNVSFDLEYSIKGGKMEELSFSSEAAKASVKIEMVFSYDKIDPDDNTATEIAKSCK